MSPTLDTSLNGRCAQQGLKQQQEHAKNPRHRVQSLMAGQPLAERNTGPFAQMLQRLELAFSRRPDSAVDVDELWRVLEDYKSSLDDWSKYAFYEPTKYKRNLVAEYDKFNVMIICWAPGTRSCIHDHSGSHCFMKMLEGELVESRFAWPDDSAQGQEMRCISKSPMRRDQVHYINDKVGLHLVENPNQTKLAASLHVYIPPYRKCKAFDQRTGRASDCKVQFYSKCGRLINEDE